MAAVILAPHPTPTPRRPALRLVAPTEPALRPRSRSVTPPPRTRPSTATFWRRRLFALLVLTSLVVVANAVASSLLARPDERSVVTAPTASAPVDVPAAAVPAAPAAPAVYVVRPGDTMWSIASHLQPDGDVRALVDQLTERAGGSGLQAGQRIALDGLGL